MAAAFTDIRTRAEARAELERRREARQPFETPLGEWIPRISPKLQNPKWLGPFVDLLVEAFERTLRIVFHAPPQHAKTSTTVHGLIRGMMLHSGRRNAYATYSAERAARVESGARIIADNAALRMRFRQRFWTDDRLGTSILWASRKGGLTGEPIDGLCVLDDVLKDRKEADSQIVRDDCGDWFDDVVEPRCHRTASIFLMMTRWNPDDLAGRLIKRGWLYVNLQALADGETDEEGFVIGDPVGRKHGEALWPERKTPEELAAKQRSNPYSFASLYQGAPRPRGGNVFIGCTYYDELPKVAYSVAFGADFAYSENKYADWSVCLEVRSAGHVVTYDVETHRPIKKPLFYLVYVIRKQVQAPEFILSVRAMTRHHPKDAIRWYAGGQEQILARFMRARIPNLKARPATEDKLQRAQAFAEAWNEGRFMLPSREALLAAGHIKRIDDEEPEWLQDFRDELQEFTGVKDKNDDQVDAGTAAHDQLVRTNPMVEAMRNRGSK